MGRPRIPDSVRQAQGLGKLRKPQVEIPKGVSLVDYALMTSNDGKFDRAKARDSIIEFAHTTYGVTDDLTAGLLADELGHYTALEYAINAEDIGSPIGLKLRRARSESLTQIQRLCRSLGLTAEGRFLDNRSRTIADDDEFAVWMAGPKGQGLTTP